MPQCPVCYTEIFSSKLKTIGDQIVCSLSCVGLLQATDKDSCYYCQRPVWIDNYYIMKDKHFCSKYCKDMMIDQFNIIDNSENVKNINENCFSTAKPVLLNNTKKLRKEVLELYNDFKFDLNIDSNKENINDNKAIHHNHNYTNTVKVHISDNGLVNTINNVNCSFDRVDNNKNLNLLNDKSEIKTIKKMIIDRIKNNNKDNNQFYESSYQSKDLIIKKNNYLKDRNNNYIEKKAPLSNRNKNNQENSWYDKNTFHKEKDISFYPTHIINSSFNTQDNLKKENKKNMNHCTYNSFSKNDLNNKGKGITYLSNDLSKNIPITNKSNNIIRNKYTSRIANKKSIICKFCLRILGNATFLDRNGNRFCSDECKNKYLNNRK